MAVLGVGMGLMVSQLGNVVQSSVEESGRSEAGGLQYTGQQLGSSLGVALIGAIVLMGLASTFISNVEKDPRISAEVAAQVGVAAGTNTNFVSADAVHTQPRRPVSTTHRHGIVEDYEAAQFLTQGRAPRRRTARSDLTRLHRELPHAQPTRKKKRQPDLAAP